MNSAKFPPILFQDNICESNVIITSKLLLPKYKHGFARKGFVYNMIDIINKTDIKEKTQLQSMKGFTSDIKMHVQ